VVLDFLGNLTSVRLRSLPDDRNQVETWLQESR
jgi:hypothetical protein